MCSLWADVLQQLSIHELLSLTETKIHTFLNGVWWKFCICFYFIFTVKSYYSRPNLNVLTVSRVWWLYHQTKQWQFPQNQTVNTGRICLENNNKCIRGWLLSSPLSWMHLKIHLIVTVLQPTGSKEIESGGHFLSWTKLKEISDVIQADGETPTGGSPEFTEKTCQRASSWV